MTGIHLMNLLLALSFRSLHFTSFSLSAAASLHFSFRFRRSKRKRKAGKQPALQLPSLFHCSAPLHNFNNFFSLPLLFSFRLSFIVPLHCGASFHSTISLFTPLEDKYYNSTVVDQWIIKLP